MNESTTVIETGFGREKVVFKSEYIGNNGLAVTVTGGKIPHVGAVSLAWIKDESAVVSNISAPGHKDHYISGKIAEIICSALKINVSVTAGLHIDNATNEEINALCENSLKAAEVFISQQQNTK